MPNFIPGSGCHATHPASDAPPYIRDWIKAHSIHGSAL